MATADVGTKARTSRTGPAELSKAWPDRRIQLRIAETDLQETTPERLCVAMTQQSGEFGRGNQSAPQKLLQLVGCRDPKARPVPWVRPRPASGQAIDHKPVHWMKSPHFWIVLSAAPQGMMGTEEVEFFGEPSISLSE